MESWPRAPKPYEFMESGLRAQKKNELMWTGGPGHQNHVNSYDLGQGVQNHMTPNIWQQKCPEKHEHLGKRDIWTIFGYLEIQKNIISEKKKDI